MNVTTAIILGLVVAIFVLVIGWLLWAQEKAERAKSGKGSPKQNGIFWGFMGGDGGNTGGGGGGDSGGGAG